MVWEYQSAHYSSFQCAEYLWVNYSCKMHVVIPCFSSECGQKASHLKTMHIVLVKCRVSGHSSLTQIHTLHFNQVMHQAIKVREVMSFW